jgi:hypothetical protein
LSKLKTRDKYFDFEARVQKMYFDAGQLPLMWTQENNILTDPIGD